MKNEKIEGTDKSWDDIEESIRKANIEDDYGKINWIKMPIYDYEGEVKFISMSIVSILNESKNLSKSRLKLLIKRKIK